MAEGLLRHRLEALGVDAVVDSAGLYEGGMRATADGIAVLEARGIPTGGHVSRNLLDAEVDLAAADLVIGMERKHLQEAVVALPDVLSRCFTLVDLVRRAEAAAPRAEGESVRAWAARLAAGRLRSELLGQGDAVDDPIGQGRDAYERTAALLDDLLGRLVARLFPTPDAADEAVAS